MKPNGFGCPTPPLPDQILFWHHHLDRCSMVLFRGTHYFDLPHKKAVQLHEALNNVTDGYIQDLRMRLMQEGLIRGEA